MNSLPLQISPSQTPPSQTPPSQTPPSQTPQNINLDKLIEKTLTPGGMKGCPPCDQATTGRYIYSVFHSIMAIVAIYLAFRCNKGFSFGPFLIACTCPYIYIIYVVATQGTCGILEKNN
jgi:hypothetical protein